MASLERIERDIERTQKKIAEWQEKLKELSGLYTEQENLHIVAAVRALKMTREELAAFIKDGALPTHLQGQTAMPTSRYSRKKPEPGIADGEGSASSDTTSYSTKESEDKEDGE